MRTVWTWLSEVEVGWVRWAGFVCHFLTEKGRVYFSLEDWSYLFPTRLKWHSGALRRLADQ